MQVSRGFENLARCRGGIVSVGNFDGVHLGHQAMIGTAVRLAAARGVPSVALTFDPHPVAVLRGEPPPSLTTTPRKLELLAECGLTATIVLAPDREFLNLSPQEFFDRIIRQELQAAGLVEGGNFRFGRNRSGDVRTMQGLCEAAGLSFECVPPVSVGGRTVSSSVVRDSLLQGDIPAANEMLGRPYCIRGCVVEGARRGRTIGFPTANLAHIATVLPPEGVYAGRAWVGGRAYATGINLGPNPTFGDFQRKFEAHLLDFTGDLYGQDLDLDLLARLRDVRPFASLEELRSQLQADMHDVRAAQPEKLGFEI